MAHDIVFKTKAFGGCDKDEVMDFVYDVLDEVAELFPFPYLHVGGDEAPVEDWKKCARCQARMRAEGKGRTS